MEIKNTYSFEDFEPWSGAKDTWETLEEYDKIGTLEAVLEELYPDGIEETTLNDILWFETEEVYNWVGLYYNPDTDVVSDEPLCYSCGEYASEVECDECLEVVCEKCAMKCSVCGKQICNECANKLGDKVFCSECCDE